MDRPAKSEQRGAVVLEGALDRSIDVRQHLATCEIGILGGMMWGVCWWRVFEDALKIDGPPNSQFEARALIIIGTARACHQGPPPGGGQKTEGTPPPKILRALNRMAKALNIPLLPEIDDNQTKFKMPSVLTKGIDTDIYSSLMIPVIILSIEPSKLAISTTPSSFPFCSPPNKHTPSHAIKAESKNKSETTQHT